MTSSHRRGANPRDRLRWVVCLTALLLSGLLLASALRRDAEAGARVAPGRQLAPAQDAPPGWRRIEVAPREGARGYFSIALPPGWAYEPLQGIDSFVGRFVSEEAELGFDFGAWSNPLPGAGEAGYQVEFERIACAKAKLVRAVEAPARVTGVFFENTGVGMGVAPFGFARLEVSGIDLSPELQELAVEIFRSIRFPDRCLSGQQGDWTIHPAPEGTVPLAVDITGPETAWAVGRGARNEDGSYGCSILRYRQGSWEPEVCPQVDMLLSIDMSSDEEGWAVGIDGIIGRSREGWWVVEDEEPLGALFDVSAPSDDQAWALGLGGVRTLRAGRWSDPDPSARGVALDMRSPNEGYAVGVRGLYRYRDGAWELMPWPEGEPYDALSALGIDVLPNDQLLMVGEGRDFEEGAFLRQLEPGALRFQPFEGSRGLWDVVNVAPETADPEGPIEAWAVGGGTGGGPAVLLHSDATGRDWERLETRFEGFVKAVDFLDRDYGWAVGAEVLREGEETELAGILLEYRAYEDASPTPTPTPSPALASPSPSRPPRTATPTASPGPGSRAYLPLAFARP